MAILGKSKIEELEILKGLTVGGDASVTGNLTAGNIEQTLTNDSAKIPSSKAVFEGTIKTATASAEKVDADSPAEVVVTNADRNSNFHFKIPSGNDGKNLLLQADSLFFRGDGLGNITEEQTITLKVQSSNLNEQIVWNDPSIPAGTSTYDVVAPIGPSFSKTYTVTADGLTSSLTIGTINEGASPYLFAPSTSNIVFSSDTDGVIDPTEFGVSATVKIWYGNIEEPLEKWTLSAQFSDGLTGSISADGQLTISGFDADTPSGLVTVTAVKEDISLSVEINCTKAAKGESPLLLVVECDNYVFTISGGPEPELEDTLPSVVSAFRILEGKIEKPFTIGASKDGWGVSAAFMAVLEDGTVTSNTALFNGDLQADGTVRVTVFDTSLQYGEILITAEHPEDGVLTATISVRAQMSAGFGTPTVTTETLQMGEEATAEVTLDSESPESAKVFRFEFGIPRGNNPIYLSLNPDSVAVNASISGYVDPDINVPEISRIKVYEGGTDVSTEGWTFYAGDPNGENGSDVNSVVFSVDPVYGYINLVGWAEGDSEDSYIRYVTARRTDGRDNVVLTKGIMFYKAKAGAGQTGPAAGFGEVTATVLQDETSGPRIEVETSGENTAKNFEFKFYNIGAGTISNLYNEVNTATDGAVTPNAVREYVGNMLKSRAVYHYEFTAQTTTYQIPNFTEGQSVVVYYNGLFLIPDVDYSLDLSTGLITFTDVLGGTTTQQQLSVVCESFGSGY